MIVFRRVLPRVQGMSACVAFAEATTDFMKRVRTVIFLSPAICRSSGDILVKSKMTLHSGRYQAELR